MSEKKDLSRLIILGAGASVDVGVYPTGAQFIEVAEKVLPMFREAFSHENLSLKHCLNETHLKHCNYISNQDLHPIENWLQKIIQARPSSIDSYISSISNKKEQSFLKSLILSIVLNCTSYSESYSEYFRQNWYFSVWQLISSKISDCKNDDEKLARLREDSFLKSFKIITFNYDVSLEFYLWQRIRDNFDLEDQARNFFKTLATNFITHIYGQILDADQISENRSLQGLMSWFEKLKGDFRPKNTTLPRVYKNISELLHHQDKHEIENNLPAQYSAKIDIAKDPSKAHLELRNFFYSSILEMSCFFLSDQRSEFRNRIKVIGEEREKKISSITQNNWDVIYILGYGFDETNNEALGLKNIKYQKGCFVTNYASDESKINQRLERLILDELLSRNYGRVGNPIIRKVGDPLGAKKYFVPLISHKSVSHALKEEFSLLENPDSPLIIETNLTPYLELKK